MFGKRVIFLQPATPILGQSTLSSMSINALERTYLTWLGAISIEVVKAAVVDRSAPGRLPFVELLLGDMNK